MAFKLKIGKKVICIDDKSSHEYLIQNNIYEIENIVFTITGDQYKLVNIPYTWNPDRFKFATAKQIRDFELNFQSKKYNL